MHRTRTYCLILSFGLAVVGCVGDKRAEPDVIPRETFVILYVDLLLHGESGQLSSTDSIKTEAARSKLDSLYTEHGVTEVQVRKMVEVYNKDLYLWKEFYDEVTKRLETMQKEEQKQRAETGKIG